MNYKLEFTRKQAWQLLKMAVVAFVLNKACMFIHGDNKSDEVEL